jgi:hypothetical protein
MKITAIISIGLEFGTDGNVVTESKTFTSIVEFESFMASKREFDAEDEVLSVKWEC